MRSIRRPDDSSCIDRARLRPHGAAVTNRRPVVRMAATVLVACAAALAFDLPAAEAAPKPLLTVGSTGAAVKKVQRRLGVRADGVFGPVTRAAVIRFQRRHGVPTTGIVGPLTRRALRRVAHRAAVRAHRRAAARLLSMGDRGRGVRRVQRRLDVRADGVFGPVTRAAVVRFQRRHGVPTTGMVGPLTRRALRRPAQRAGRGQGRHATRAPLLSVGDRGRAVRRVQRRLRVPADGVFGPVTRAAVIRFQRRHGVPATGMVGPLTRRALRRAAHRAGRGHGRHAARAPLLSIGDRGRRVARLQRRLGVAADGVFGPVTRAAVIRFQRRHGVPATGMVGPLTRRALRRASHRSAVRHTAGRRLTVGRRAVRIARRYLGVPYRWGGASPGSGFDCSGLVMYVYAQLGIGLPHYTVSQYRYGRRVRRSRLRRGDLVFFNGLGHVGIYIGHNRMIHAPSTGQSVKISRLTGWYARTYVGARRVT